jgi:hypothetical protein
MIPEEKAIEIARNDAETAYEDLSQFTVTTTFDGTNWHVKYVLDRDEVVDGGGPEYVISGESGEILEKKYWQ